MTTTPALASFVDARTKLRSHTRGFGHLGQLPSDVRRPNTTPQRNPATRRHKKTKNHFSKHFVQELGERNHLGAPSTKHPFPNSPQPTSTTRGERAASLPQAPPNPTYPSSLPRHLPPLNRRRPSLQRLGQRLQPLRNVAVLALHRTHQLLRPLSASVERRREGGGGSGERTVAKWWMTRARRRRFVGSSLRADQSVGPPGCFECEPQHSCWRQKAEEPSVAEGVL